MQQTLSQQQLKCYGRRNRSKPKVGGGGGGNQHVYPGSVEEVGRPVAAQVEEEETDSASLAKLPEEVKLSGQLSTPEAGWGRSRKSTAATEEEVTPKSDVVKKQMPTTRRNSAIKSLVGHGREATGVEPPGKEVSFSPGVFSNTPEKEGSEELVSVSIKCISSNGGLEQRGKKIRVVAGGLGSAGTRKTRAQIARDEAQRMAGGEQPGLENNDVAITSTAIAAARHIQETLERRKREDQILTKVDEIWSKREFIEANKDKKVQPKSREPVRSKSHWDFVLEEMAWLAKDFERERKWKVAQAKKVVIRVSRSKLDVEAREIRRQKEEEQRMRRVASGFAKEVKKFWMKVDKLVTYKQQLQIEERKKKALDKHLDFLLGQTERYSTMLAENLTDPLVVYDHQSIQLLPPVPLDDSIAEELLDSKQDLVLKELEVTGEGNNRDRIINLDLEGVDQDFVLNDEEEQEDDEATLEADEALITESERREELNALQQESELPLDQLLKNYKMGEDSEEEDQEYSEGETDEEPEDSEEDEEEVDKEMNFDDKEGLPKAVKAIIPEQSQHGTVHDGTSRDEAEELTRSSWNAKDGAKLMPEMEDSRNLVGSVRSAECGLVADEQTKAGEKALVMMVQGLKKSQSVLQNDLGMPHSDRTITGHFLETNQYKAGGKLATLVVDLGVDTREDVSSSLSQRRPQRSICCLTTVPVEQGMVRDMQDDEDYFPAAMADGHEEDDDEGTLEEEEQLAKEDDASSANEIDDLQRESEMTLKELLAKYKSLANENNEDTGDPPEDLGDILEDRQDRTSEAGTSGSSDEEEEDDHDSAQCVAETKARMGQPSTSGRDHPPTVSPRSPSQTNNEHVVESLELKQKAMENRWPQKTSDGYRKVDLHEAQQKSANGGGRERNGVLREKMPIGLFGTSLLLQVDGEVDAEAAAALAKVTEAARRRGERMVLRASFASKEDIQSSSKSSMAEEIATPMVESNQVKVLSATGTSGSMNIEPALSIVSLGALPHGSAIGNGDNVGVDATVEGWAVPATLVSPSSDEGKPVLGPSPEAAGPVKDESPLLEDNGSADLEKQELVEEQSSEIQLADAAAAAQSVQPTGYTYSTTKVRTNLPFLLKHSLREYQHIGLDWLVTMYEKRLNGILADEMGLGKTIMTIALLAHLACEKGIWGPHLIVVPTSVMLNWETEFMKWCPAFKILTYFGSAKERKVKRQGWSRSNSFHVCITTYRLVIQDAKAFKRKKWKYLILDEAHLIKNWKSQRWQTLLNFNSKRRILLTGTPLQNDLMELWSLMHFLMPHVFQSHQEFRDWFSNPITGMVEGQEQVNKDLVDRLHNVLRPFLLRRLKKDVEKQLPGKFEHVICCQLSKRQRNLYEDFMASSETQETLASGNFLGLINVLMQLRKVCNHPDLFEGRPIISSFDMPGIEVHLSSAACSAVKLDIFNAICKEIFCLNKTEHDMAMWEAEEVTMMKTPGPMIVELGSSGEDTWKQSYTNHKPSKEVRGVIEEIQAILQTNREKERKEQMLAFSFLNDMRCSRHPVYGSDLRKLVEIEHPVHDVHKIKANPSRYLEFSSIVADIVKLPLTRFKRMMDLIAAFLFAIPAARTPQPSAWCSHLTPTDSPLQLELTERSSKEASMMLVPLRPVIVRRQLFFPDRRLLQFDCGKLQELAVLLRQLKSDGHRALIFTQMTKMLDVLESFINLYGYTYMRLDGSTKPEQRQILMQRFNTNPKIFLFILSTRSGGVGINLVGADTVIFYDSDWNPAMDQQAQDRCHRIGQTREVHIYRLVSESTIEENILKKANQKRILDDLVIQSGSYNTEFFKKLDPMELFSGLKGVKLDGADGKGQGTALITANVPVPSIGGHEQRELSVAEVEAALKNAEDEADYMAMKRVEQEEAAENQEFTEEVFAGNIDDEDLGDDEEAGKGVSTPGMLESEVMGVPGASRVDQQSEEGDAAPVAEESTLAGTSLIPADVEEDMDMLADVRQMAAAAAAAGREKTSFEDQLRPVERYAMRFLELWDPRVNNLAIEAQVAFEEKEWELDQLEKLKEEQEAEIDEDNEPLFYENWDTAFADQAYHQQVEVLAQQQENQRQLEWEAMEEDMRDADRSIAEAAASIWGAENFSLKSKGKNAKKAKFKSLAEGSLMTASGIETPLAEEYLPGSSDPLYIADQSNLPYPSQRKRKAQKILGEEMLVDMHSKKLRKEPFKDTGISMEKVKGKKNLSESDFRRLPGDASESSWPGFVGLEGSAVHGDPVIPGTPGMPFVKNKGGGKISIMGIKKGPLVMLEKEKKKDVAKSQEHIPQAAPWAHIEDAVLCAVVHEYGGNWLLASETLAGNPDGGIYRGRYRHPVHCRERFRQLLVQNGAAVTVDPSSEKSTLNAASNAQLKVTEEHTRRLLDVVQQLPDDELLLPRHFAALLNAVQAQRRAASQQNPEKPMLFAHSPRGRPFVTIPNLRRPSVHLNGPFVNGHHAGRPNPAEVLKVLIQSDKTERKVASAHVPSGQEMQSPKDLASNVDESFSVQDFLVGSNDTNSSLSGRIQPATSQFKPPVSIEDLLGISSVSVVPHVPAKAFRHTAEVLVDQRYRLAAIMGLEGSANEWAAAAASGTGVVGLQVPTKGKNVVKKHPAPDPDKPSKPKKPRIPKADNEKGAPGDCKLGNKPSNQQSVTSVMQKKKLAVQNSAAYSSLSTPLARAAQGAAESLPPPILPSSVGKTAGDVPVDAAAPVGSEDCGPPKDLEGFLHQQAPLPPEGNQNATTVAKTQKSKKPKIRVEASAGGAKLPHKGEKRASATPKKSSSRSQKVNADSAAGSGISTGGGKRADAIVEKGIDLNNINSSDDEVTITGVTPGGAGMRPETLNALRSRLESASSVSQGLEERIGMSRKVKGTETASRRTTKDESDSALWSTLSDTRQSSLKERATGTNQSLSGVGIDPQNGSPAPHRGGLRGTGLGPVGLTKSSFPAPAISGNPSVITKRTDWRPVSAVPRQDPFSSLPSVLPKELSQLQWDPPPPGVWPNPSLPDLQYPLENLRRFADDMAKRSPSTGACFSVPKGNRKSGVISSFQFQPGKEASEALGSNSLNVVIDSRGREGRMQKVQGSSSALGNQSNELSDWETLRNEQQPRGSGDLTPESISRMQAHSLRSAGFSSGRISHGGHLTRYAFSSEQTSSPQHLLGTGLNTEHQLLYSSPSPSRTVKMPPDSQPSSSASSPHQQLYNNHQLSSNTLPLFVGSVVVQESSLGPDLGLSLGPDVQQPGVHFPQDEQHHTLSS